MKKLLVVDGNSVLNRAFFGIRPLTTSKGLQTNAVYGMINMINSHLDAIKPDYTAVAFDMKAPTFRHLKYDGYKSNRHGMPNELAVQLPYAKKVCRALGFSVIEKEGYEADDILGTLAKTAEGNGVFSYILTGDRDSFQLISDSVNVLLCSNSGALAFDRRAFNEKYGVEPEVFVDVKALMGDASDCIPGVPGIGEKTALKLISEYGSLDNLYANYENSALTKGIKDKLSRGKDSAYLSQFLARIKVDAPIEKTLADIEYGGPDYDSLIPLLTELEFTQMIKKLCVSSDSEVDKITMLASLSELEAGKTYAVYFDGGSIGISDGAASYRCEKKADELREFFGEKSSDKIFFDVKSAAHILDKDGIEIKCGFFDIMLAGYVKDSQGRCGSVGEMSASYLNIIFDEDKHCRAKKIYEIYKEIDALLDEKEHRILYDLEQPLALVLFDMEKTGFKVNVKGLSEYSDRLTERNAELEKEIYVLAGCEFNINSPKQLGNVLFEKLELPSFKKTKSGYSTNAEVLEKLRPFHPIIDKIFEYRQTAKLNSTYAIGLQGAADKNGVVHTTFNQTVTATGRLSSTEPNLQNIPIRTELGREMRRFFVPNGENRVLIDADYSQIELRLLAEISKDETMTNAFLNGIDIHTLTASQVFHVFPEAVTAEMRKKAKAVNFGIVYGIGDYSLANDIHVSRKQAGEYIENYLATYPKIDAYLKENIKIAHRQGYVCTVMGRKRYIPELTSGKKTLVAFGERVAMNSPIQGSAADIIKLAMIGTFKALKEAKIDARLILQVHDELLLDTARDCKDRAMEILKREMENAIKTTVPLSVEVNFGDTWYDAK